MKELKNLERWSNYIVKALLKARSKNLLVGNVYDSNLSGACAIGSFGLWEKAQLSGYKDVDFVFGCFKQKSKMLDHCWVIYKNKIIDPTHYQFDPLSKKAKIFDIQNEKFKSKIVGHKAIDYALTWLQGQSPLNYEFIWKPRSCELQPTDYFYDEVF